MSEGESIKVNALEWGWGEEKQMRGNEYNYEWEKNVCL